MDESIKNPFTIQCGHPTIKDVEAVQFDTLSDVFPYLFHENEESAYIFWNEIPIRMHYTYELYKNIDDIIGLCWLLQKEVSGAMEASFMQDQLIMKWEVRWKNSEVEIVGDFLGRTPSYDSYAKALNENSIIRMPLASFLSEWKALLMQLTKAIQTSGITIEDGIERRRYELMLRSEKKIKGLGVLYKPEEVIE